MLDLLSRNSTQKHHASGKPTHSQSPPAHCWRSLNPQPSVFSCKQVPFQNTNTNNWNFQKALHILGNFQPKPLENECHEIPLTAVTECTATQPRMPQKGGEGLFLLKFFIYKKVHFSFPQLSHYWFFIQVKGRVMQHPAHTNYNHENFPPAPNPGLKMNKLQRMENKTK